MGLDEPGCCCSNLDAYAEGFDETSDPRPPRSCLCWVPVCWVRPGRCERRYGKTVYACFGATLARCLLKATCYRWLRPLAKTERGTNDRRTACIKIIPMFIGIEIGHLIGLLAHLAGASVGFALRNSNAPDEDNAVLSFVLQLVLIYFLHFLPICVQRLNRVEVYIALLDQAKGDDATMP